MDGWLLIVIVIGIFTLAYSAPTMPPDSEPDVIVVHMPDRNRTGGCLLGLLPLAVVFGLIVNEMIKNVYV